MLKIYFIGLFILIAAILLNFIAGRLNLMSWYDFLTRIAAEGRSIFSIMKWTDYSWLFLIYPFLLGLSGWVGYKLSLMIFK